MELQGKVAIVTGAGSGISKAMALALAQAGARIVAVDVAEAAAKQTASEIRAAGFAATSVGADVTRKGEIEGALGHALGEFGQVDILFNGAGVNRRRSISEISEEEWELVLRVNLKGTFLCCQVMSSYMAERGKGRIINMAGHHSAGAAVHYGASKGGIIAFTEILAAELKPKGVTVNAIGPGPTDTPLWRGGRSPDEIEALLRRGNIGKPGDMAGVVVFLASDASWPLTGRLIERG